MLLVVMGYSLCFLTFFSPFWDGVVLSYRKAVSSRNKLVGFPCAFLLTVFFRRFLLRSCSFSHLARTPRTPFGHVRVTVLMSAGPPLPSPSPISFFCFVESDTPFFRGPSAVSVDCSVFHFSIFWTRSLVRQCLKFLNFFPQRFRSLQAHAFPSSISLRSRFFFLVEVHLFFCPSLSLAIFFLSEVLAPSQYIFFLILPFRGRI